MKDFFKIIENETCNSEIPENTKVICENCGWKGRIKDCSIEWEQDGWENPKYETLVCPKCGSEVEF